MPLYNLKKMNQLKYIRLFKYIEGRDWEGLSDRLKGEDFDFEEFRDFTDRQGLSGGLYSALEESRSSGLLPEELVQHYKSTYMRQWITNEKLLREMTVLSDLFKEHGAEVIFLKGPIFAQRFYGDIDRRAMGDIDILIRKEDLIFFDELLIKNAFRRISVALFNKKLASRYVHHFEYRKGDIDLELHWALANHFSFDLDYAKIWREKQRYPFKDRVFHILPDEYELVLQILSIFKDIGLGTIKYRSLLDCYIALKASYDTIDWSDFFERRRREGILAISLNVLDIALDLFDADGDFVALSRYMNKNSESIKCRDMESKLKLLNDSGGALNGKRWAFGLYQAPLVKSFCWWSASLPFRVAMHRQ